MTKAKTPLPPGCSEVKSSTDTKKKHYRCPILGWSVGMELRRCSFHDRRKRLAEHIANGTHIFNIPRKNDEGFPKDFTLKEKIGNKDQIQITIMRALAVLASNLNISAKKATSDKMEDFIYLLLKIGIKLKTTLKDQSLIVQDIFHMQNINKITDYIRMAGEEACRNVLPLFNEKFTCLEMDSGTVHKLKAINYVISIPEDETLKPFLYNLTPNNNFDSYLYSITTDSILKELFEKKIYICGILVDNLKCQTKGLEIMKKVSDNPLFHSIYIVHCFCHLTSLVFVNTLNHNSHLSILVNSVKNIVTILRKNSAKTFIGKKCPSIVETRWLYLHDILIFIDNFKDEVKTLLITTNENQLLEKLPEILELINIIKPLRYFCNAMEKNNSICSVFPYVIEMINYFRKQTFKYVKDIFVDIFTNLIARIKTNNFDLVLCSFLLSAQGRMYFRQRYSISVKEFFPNERHYKYPSLFESDDDYPGYDTVEESSLRLFLENTIQNSESNAIDLHNSEPQLPNDDECSELYKNYHKYFEELKKSKFEEILNMDLFANAKMITENVLKD